MTTIEEIETLIAAIDDPVLGLSLMAAVESYAVKCYNAGKRVGQQQGYSNGSMDVDSYKSNR